MEEWQSVFEEWFPKEINKSYPIKISKQYTSSQRWEIYAKLTKKQRELVDKHRRYLISSRFMEEHYLAATDWVFSRSIRFFEQNEASKNCIANVGEN